MGRARNTRHLRALRGVVIRQCTTDPARVSNYQNILQEKLNRGPNATIKRLLSHWLAHSRYLR